MRYVWAVTLVAAGLLVCFVAHPLFAPNQAYAAFYPVVLIAAYALGPRPAMLATGLSAAVAVWCFAPPAFHWSLEGASGTALGVFLGASGLAIYLIAGVVRLLEAVAWRQGRVEALARSQVELLRELNMRFANRPKAAPPARYEPEAPEAPDQAAQAPERSFQPTAEPRRAAATLH